MPPVALPSVAAIPSGFWRWPHVDPAREWACKGTGQILIVPEFLDRIEALRAACGFALPIASGYRSPEHNVTVSTTGEDGPHTTGQAADIRIYGSRAVTLIAAAESLGFTGLGVKQHGPVLGRFIHLDDLVAAANRPRPWLWSYT